MTGYPDCSLGSICSDGSLILHIKGNGFECNPENQIQREPCNLPPCEKGKQLGTIQQLRHAVVAPTGVGKNDGSMMHRGGW